MLDFMSLGTRNFQGRFLQWTTAFELFYSTFTLDFFLKENKRKTVLEIRLEDVHRGQTYLTASHSQLRYLCYFFN